MKKHSITFLLSILMSMLGLEAMAHDIEVKNADGVTIYYIFRNNNTELAVSCRGNFSYTYSNEYIGNVVIPETVTYNGSTYPVTSISNTAFMDCIGLNSITIPNSVTSIGERAFMDCNGLESITIPNSVTSIGSDAFHDCSCLTSLTIGNSVTSIGESAFFNCTGLTSVTIPNSVTSIGSDAFQDCSCLTSLTIGSSVASIGYRAFEGCSGLTSVTFHCQTIGQWFSGLTSIKNIVIGDEVISIGSSAFYGCRSLNSVTIGNSVTSIGESAFYGCSGLNSITIGNSVTSIGERALRDCIGLEHITIGKSVTSIGNYAFQNCNGLTSVTFHCPTIKNWFSGFTGIKNIVISDEVTSIESNAFNGCSGLEEVHISSLESWLNISFGSNPLALAHHLYLNGEEIKDLIIPNSVTSIGSNAFESCSSLTSVTIPNSVTSIGSNAFKNCSGLTSVTFHCPTIKNWFSGFTGIKNIVISDEVTSIESNAFNGCSGLEEVHISSLESWLNISFGSNPLALAHHLYLNGEEIKDLIIPNSVTSIGNNSFSGCSSLTSVTIPNSVTSIGNDAFADCCGLTSVNIPNSVTSIGNYAFYNTYLKTVTIGTGVLSIGSRIYAYGTLSYGYNRPPTKVIWLPNTPPSGYSSAGGTVNYVANDQYSTSSLKNKTVYNFLSSIFEVDGVKYVPVSPSERTCDAIDSDYNESAEHVKIGETVNYKGISLTVDKVQPYVCYGNTFIKKAEVDLSRSISDYSFSGCTSLQNVKLGEQVSSIGNYAFDGCTSLQAIDIPNSATSIGSYAFRNCSMMGLAKIGNTVETIGTYSFSGCAILSAIELPQSVTKVDNYVFSGCTSLKDVIVADRNTILTLGSNGSSPLFADCSLDSVYIGGDISYKTSSSYGYSPFYRNTSLRSVHITDQETEISGNEFYGCTGLKNVRIGDGVTTIGNWAFSGCSSLSYFAFGSSLQTIGQEAFSDCTAVGEIISKAATPPTCGSQAIDDISKWECKLFVPEGTLATYQQADQWKDFFFAEEGAGSGNPGIHEAEKCATPVITFADGKLKFTCATAGVEYHYDITADGSKSGTGSQTDLTTTYTISVYASKEGFDNSETVRKTIITGGTGGQVGDVNGDGEVNAVDLTKLIEILLQ